MCEKKKFLSNKIVIGVIGLILLIIFLRTVIELNIPIIVPLLLSFIIALWGDETQVVAFALSCIPLSIAFQYKYALLFCIIVYVIKSKFKVKVNAYTFIIGILMIWELLHAFIFAFSIIEYFRSFAELLMLIIITTMPEGKLDGIYIKRMLMFATVGVCSIIFLYQFVNSGYNLSFIIESFRFGSGNTNMTNFGLNVNPNRLGYMCNLSCTAFLILYSKNAHKITDVVFFVASVIFGLLTLSRTFIVCFFAVVLYSTFVIKGRKTSLLKRLLLFGCILIIISGLLYFFMPNIFDSFTSRFSEEDLLNGRDYVYDKYSEHIWSSPFYCFFGIGMQDMATKMSILYGETWQICHNGYQQAWVAWGIGGLFLFIVFLIRLALENVSYNSYERINYLPLLLFIIYIFVSQSITSGPVMLSTVYIYSCLCCESGSKEGEFNGKKDYRKFVNI